jgi:hypothetical protein
MLARWLVTLFLSLALGGGLYAAYYAYLENENAKANKEALEASLRQLTTVEQTLRQQAQQVASWTTLWEDTQEVGLIQDKWVTNQLDSKRVADWTQVEQFLSFLSNTDPVSTGYWFKPDYISVVRGDRGEDEELEEDEEETAPSDEDAEDGATYTLTGKGEFLIPKL